MQEIPFDLRRQLPSAPRGTRYVYVDDQLLLINVKTRVVLDFINIKVPTNHNTYNRKSAPRTVDRMPSYQRQRPDHQPPSHARAHEVAKGKPFTDDEHPSSHGQSYNGHRGKPDRGDDHPSQHAKNDRGHGQQGDRGKPLWRDDHQPSSQGHGMGRGKPDQGKGHSSQPAQGNQGRNKGGYLKPSTHGKADKDHQGGGRPQQEIDRPSSMQQEHQGEPQHGNQGPQGGQKGGPPEDKGRLSSHSKADKDHQGGGIPQEKMGRPSSMQQDRQGGQQGGPPEDKGRPSKDKGKPSMDSPMADDSGSQQMDDRGKPDKRNPKGRGKQKDTFADSSGQEDSSAQSFSPPEENVHVAKTDKGRGGKGNSKGSGKPEKMKRGKRGQQTETTAASAPQEPAPSMAPMEQEPPSQPMQTQQEEIQVAKVERGRGKGRSKGSGKPEKMKRGKREQQTDTTAASAPQEPAPSMTPPKPTTTASIAPAVFDNNQRSIIQSYYQNSGSKKSGKGKGKKTRGSKRNKTSSVSKNDILTQSTEPLPRSLESQLPPTPPNSKRVLYNHQVLLIERGTNRVLDTINVNN